MRPLNPGSQYLSNILEMKLSQLSEADFASTRKALRKPIVKVDNAIHRIDSLLNQTQKDPSNLSAAANNIAKSLNTALEPLRDVKDGIQQLQGAAHAFDAKAEYVGSKPNEPEQPAQADPIALAAKDVADNKGTLSSQQSLLRAYGIYKQNGGQAKLAQFTTELGNYFRKNKPHNKGVGI